MSDTLLAWPVRAAAADSPERTKVVPGGVTGGRDARVWSAGPARVILRCVAHHFAYLDAPTPLAFAHRGGAAAGDENTAAAFERAAGLGYRYVETDVHATADRVAVVFHDPTLRRLTGRPGRVRDLSWAELRMVRVGGRAAVPRLDEVLLRWPRLRFNIDVKSDDAVGPAWAAIRDAGAQDRVLLASFSDARLARLRALAGPGVASSAGVREVLRLRLGSLTGCPVRLPSSVVAAQVPVRYRGVPVVDRRFVRYIHRLGLQVHVWTINDPVEMNALLDLGVDGIVSDQVRVLRDVLAGRGLWTGG